MSRVCESDLEGSLSDVWADVVSKGQQIARRVTDLAISLGSGRPKGQGKYLLLVWKNHKNFQSQSCLLWQDSFGESEYGMYGQGRGDDGLILI